MSDGRAFRVAVVGATGLVGSEIVALLDERGFPVADLLLYAAEDSEGSEVDFRGEVRRVERFPEAPPKVDVVFLCATPEISRKVGSRLAAEGAVAIDLAPESTGDAGVPVVLGVGDLAPTAWQASGGLRVRVPDPLSRLVAVPLRALAPLGRIERAIATFLVSASAFGRKRVERLSEETLALLNLREPESDASLPELAFRCAPDVSSDSASTSRRVGAEISQLIGAVAPVAANVVEVPMFFGQAASLSVEFQSPALGDQARSILRETPSLVVADGGSERLTTLDALDTDGILVVGLRQEACDPKWLHLWLLGDNVRQGGALAAVALVEGLLLRSRGPAPAKAPGG